MYGQGQQMYIEPNQQLYFQPTQPNYNQPMMQPQYPQYPQQQGPTIIRIDHHGHTSDTPCPFCGKATGQVTRRSCGAVAVIWGLFLSFWCCCCIPCCMDSCKDTEIVCITCKNIKTTVPATCC